MPCMEHKPSTDANYEAICGVMLQNMDVIEPAFATPQHSLAGPRYGPDKRKYLRYSQ